MSLFARRRGRSILMFAVLFVTLLGAAVSAQEAEQPGVAAYVAGDIPNNEKKVLGAYLLNAIIKAGQGKSADGAEAFLAAAMADEQAKGGANLSMTRVCELGKQFNIRFICAASVTHAFEFFVISANIIDAEMETVLFKGEAQSPLKSINDITQASNQIVGSMFDINISDAQTAAVPMPAQNAEGAPPAAVYVAGDAKVVVDRVVAAVNAFKEATAKSIDAANTVKTVAQSKNIFAIKDAKKKVEDAVEAVKRAKADVTAAIDALNSAGPEAQAAVRSMGIDLSMFGGNDGSSDIENFTTGERVATVFMNQAVPGLGSGIIMRDMVGLGMQIGISALGAGLISASAAASDYDTRTILTGIGIGALSANLTYNIIRSATYRKPGSIKPIKPPPSPWRFDYYISPKYQAPVGTPVSWGGVNLETGLIWGEGGFLGLDFSYGVSDVSYGVLDGYRYGYRDGRDNDNKKNNQFGGGLSLGKAYDFGNGLQFVYGMSAGFWFVEEGLNFSDYKEYSSEYWYYYSCRYNQNKSRNFLAPFIKLRYNVFEITYRGLLGFYEKEEGEAYCNYNEYNHTYNIYYPHMGEKNYDDGFGYNSHQLMLGLYFATNKRQRK